MLKLLTTIAVLVAAPSAMAAETDWQQLGEGVRARLISNDRIEAGKTWIALEMELPPDTYTYWRVPGETGIPPRFNFAGSRGITGAEIAWPYPQRLDHQGYLDHVYADYLVLPLELTVSGPEIRVRVEAVLGICSEVCVPVRARFELPLDADPDAANALRIQQALAQVPLADAGDAYFGAARIHAQSGAISIEEVGPGASGVIAEVVGTMALYNVPHSAGDILVFDLLGRPETVAGASRQVRLTFDTQHGPMEVIRDLSVQ